MAATPYSVAHAINLHAQCPVDSDVGVINGMENEGLLVKSIGYKPTRTTNWHKNHRGFDVVGVMTNPKLVLSVDADISLLGGALAAKHPGRPIHKSYVRDFYPALAHEFTDANGYFIYDEVDTGSPAGDLNTGKFSLTWFQAPSNTCQLVAAPSAP